VRGEEEVDGEGTVGGGGWGELGGEREKRREMW